MDVFAVAQWISEDGNDRRQGVQMDDPGDGRSVRGKIREDGKVKHRAELPGH